MKENKTQVVTPISMTAQEQALVGKWALKKSEKYEISGIDSAGQYICTLISSSTCDSLCAIEFKKVYRSPPYVLDFYGIGSIGGCDPSASFVWKAKQVNKLEIGSGSFYDIVYLTQDSLAFSTVYVIDILKLKSIVYYKRN